jgi:hypothetical protein
MLFVFFFYVVSHKWVCLKIEYPTYIYIHIKYIYIRSCTPTNDYLLVSPIFKLTWLSFQPWQRHVHFELPRFYVQDYILVPSDDTRPLLCAAGMTPTGVDRCASPIRMNYNRLTMKAIYEKAKSKQQHWLFKLVCPFNDKDI